ncbi:MAG: helix-turn-helix domain-containing protein [Chrysiogenales bacterium]|nr:MAG: helix-turn-helix domain-containing protein [Chrysiogenales bacterium]
MRSERYPVAMGGALLSAFLAATFILVAGCRVDDDSERAIIRWQVLFSQEPSLGTVYGEKGWQDVSIPSLFTLPYPPERAIRHLWLRGEVTLADPGDYYGISLGRVYYTDSVYVNRRLVGGRHTTIIQDLHAPRNYEIPPGVLVPGKNIIHVRLGIYGREYGGIADRVRLLSHDSFIRTSILMEFLYRQLTVGIMILFLGQIAFLVLQLLWRNREAITIIALVIFLIWISYLMALFSPYYPFSPDFRITLLWGSACFVPIFFFLFIQYYYRIFLTAINMIYIPVLVVFTILCLINQDTTSPYYLGRELGVAGLVLSVPVHLYALYYISKRRPGKTIIYFIVLGLLPACVIVWDIVNYLYIRHFPPLYHIYTLPGIVILFMTLRIKDAMKKEIRLEVLYESLKNAIGDSPPSPEPEGAAASGRREKDLTPAMEEKLGKVLDFLNTNYLSDISREGLARAMELSPDHMSRKFKAYTGYRISDYINKLRIEDAARQLITTDCKIIEIAFSVGFESLVTFNRAFLKTRDMTPSDYRKLRKNREGATVADYDQDDLP